MENQTREYLKVVLAEYIKELHPGYSQKITQEVVSASLDGNKFGVTKDFLLFAIEKLLKEQKHD